MKRSFLLMMVVFSIVSLPAFSQKTIKGKILDQNGSPVPFATIAIKNINTVADQYGVFDVRVAAYPSSVTVTAIGFDKLLFKTGSDSILNITLQSKRGTELESVVVTGLGQAVTHGISHYSTSQANVRGLSAANNALSGKVAGVSVRSSNYIPAQGQPQWMVKENGFHTVTRDPLSTFSTDVDPASYSHLRRMLNEGYRPPAEAVRIEEMINYFKYNYPQPTGADPFSINTETSSCPWNPKHKLLLIGMQGKKIPVENLPASNLVFLIDVSGSMMSEDKLGLVKSSLSLLTDQLRKQDKISIVVYAGAAGLVLEPTNGDQKKIIKDALNNLEAGGSTAGGAGLK
ncbi:MAG: VWA domain-containing protein, partial [Pedobacter sp.]